MEQVHNLSFDKPLQVTPSSCLVTFNYDGNGNNKFTGRLFFIGTDKIVTVHYDWNDKNEVVNKFDDMNFGRIYQAELEGGVKCFLYARKKYVAVKYAQGRISQEKLSYSLLSVEQAEKYIPDTNGDRFCRESQLEDKCFA